MLKTSLRTWLRTSAVSALALWSGACGGIAADEGSELSPEHEFFAEQAAEEGASGNEALPNEPAAPSPESDLAARSSSVTWFQWVKGEAQKTLHPVSTHVCGLAMVRGQFANDTNVRLNRVGGNWVMGGANAAANTLQMQAVCEPLSAFRTNAGRTISHTGEWGAVTTANNSSKVVSLPAGTAGILTGVWGRLEGGGERARTTLIPTLEIKKGSQGGGHAAYGTALSFGLAAGETPFYSDETQPRSESWDHIIVGCDGSADGCANGRNIAPLATTFCYLVSVSGDFNGADEWVQVYPRYADGTWRTKGFVSSGNGVAMRAECLMNDQRRGIVNPPR